MGLKPETRDVPFRHRLWRDGPVSHEATNAGLLLPGGKHAAFHRFFDFEEWLDSGSGIEGWHLSTGTGSPTAAAVVAAGVNGEVLMKPGSSAGDNVHYQWATNTTVIEPITMAVGKRTLIRARFKIEDADQNLLVMGLHEANDDPWNAYPNDSFLFRTASGDADGLVFSVSTVNSAITNSTAYTLSDDTFYVAEAYYDGAGTVQVRIYDGSSFDLLSEEYVDAPSTVIPGTPMTFAIGCEAVDTGADDFTLDFFEVFQERFTGGV